MVSGAQLIRSLRCSAQGSTCFLQCPLILLAEEEPPSALSGWVHIDSRAGPSLRKSQKTIPFELAGPTGWAGHCDLPAPYK